MERSNRSGGKRLEEITRWHSYATSLFQIKSCRVALLKWSKGLLTNSGKQIKELKIEIEKLGKQKGSKDW